MAIESGVRHRRLVGRYYCSRAIGWSLPMFIWSSQRKMLCEEVERMIERERSSWWRSSAPPPNW